MILFSTEIINLYGSYASILGTVISLITLGYALFIQRQLKDFNKKVLFNTRIKALKKDLDEHVNKLNSMLNDYSNELNTIRAELREFMATYNSILQKLNSTQKKEFRRENIEVNHILRGNLVVTKGENNSNWKIFSTKEYDKDDIWNVYEKIAYSSKVLDNLIKDHKITQNG